MGKNGDCTNGHGSWGLSEIAMPSEFLNFAVEGDEVGTPGTAEGPADLGADENWTRGASELEEAPPRVTQTSILSPTGAPHWSCSLHVRREVWRPEHAGAADEFGQI